jgi:hypothetical protein
MATIEGIVKVLPILGVALVIASCSAPPNQPPDPNAGQPWFSYRLVNNTGRPLYVKPVSVEPRKGTNVVQPGKAIEQIVQQPIERRNGANEYLGFVLYESGSSTTTPQDLPIGYVLLPASALRFRNGDQPVMATIRAEPDELIIECGDWRQTLSYLQNRAAQPAK